MTSGVGVAEGDAEALGSIVGSIAGLLTDSGVSSIFGAAVGSVIGEAASLLGVSWPMVVVSSAFGSTVGVATGTISGITSARELRTGAETVGEGCGVGAASRFGDGGVCDGGTAAVNAIGFGPISASRPSSFPFTFL